MRNGLVASIVLLLAASSAQAAPLPDKLTIPDNLDCRQTFASYGPTGIPSWNIGDRGRLRMHVDQNNFKPTSYDFTASWLTTEARAGGWSWNGHVNFNSGPLALQREGWPTLVGYWHPRPVAMPHDNVPGRTANLVLESLSKASGGGASTYAPAVRGQEGKDGHQSSYWYCGKHGVRPQPLLAGLTRRVHKRSGLKVHLPTWVEPELQNRETGYRGSVRALKRGTYTLQLFSRPCRPCQPLVIFNAKRAPATQLGHRNPVRLARGVRGWYGDVGCGFHGGDDWGPVFCGMNVVVWHYRGINYAIQGEGQDNDQLIAYANETIKYG
jgi:hypothetical protein